MPRLDRATDLRKPSLRPSCTSRTNGASRSTATTTACCPDLWRRCGASAARRCALARTLPAPCLQLDWARTPPGPCLPAAPCLHSHFACLQRLGRLHPFACTRTMLAQQLACTRACVGCRPRSHAGALGATAAACTHGQLHSAGHGRGGFSRVQALRRRRGPVSRTHGTARAMVRGASDETARCVGVRRVATGTCEQTAAGPFEGVGGGA